MFRMHLVRFCSVLIVATLVVALPASAQTLGNLKGRWRVTIRPETGASLVTNFVIKKNGTGKGGDWVTGGPIATRQTAGTIEIAWQFGGAVIPVAFHDGPATIVLRADRTGGDTLQGRAIFISDREDAGTPGGYAITSGTFVAVRESAASTGQE